MGAAPRIPLKTPQSMGFYTIDAIIRHRATEDDQVPLLAYPTAKNEIDNYELFTGKVLNRLIDGAAKAFLKNGFEPVVCH